MSKVVQKLDGLKKIKDVAFLRLKLQDKKGKTTFSRNVYWLSAQPDVLDWSDSNWYYTPVTDYANYTKLQHLAPARVMVTFRPLEERKKSIWKKALVQLENKSKVPALFIRLNVINSSGAEMAPIYWSDNYVTLWPSERLSLSVSSKESFKGSFVHIPWRN